MAIIGVKYVRTRASASGSTCASTRMRRRCKIDLDQSVPGGRQLPYPAVIFGRKLRIFLARFYRAAICTGANMAPIRSAVRAAGAR